MNVRDDEEKDEEFRGGIQNNSEDFLNILTVIDTGL